ncbi:MAG: acyltransferase family protein [Anaerolineae bacterium]
MPKSSQLFQPAPTKPTRFHFIDNLRGVAAIAVTLSHLIWLLPFPLTLFEYGRLGVEIFFVISGFVMAYSLRNQTINGRFFAKFFLRRSIRLDPPYWVALIIELIILVLWAAPLPDLRTLLLNLAYLQEIFPVYSISSVAWTLCLELQFYLFFVLLLGFSRFIATRFNLSSKWVHGIIFGIVAVLSMLGGISWGVHPIFEMLYIPGLFLPYWHIFFAGVLINWVLFKKAQPFVLWVYLSIKLLLVFSSGATTYFPNDDLSPLFSVLVSCVIYGVGLTSMLKSGMKSKVISYFGRISYSLYLLHVPIGVNLIYLVEGYFGGRARFMLPAAALAFLASVFAAHFMYKYVEEPSVKLGIRAKSWTMPKFNQEPSTY